MTAHARGRDARAKTVALISLGCAKNLVDSEVMLGVLKRSGFGFAARPEDADVIVVNTCGFIRPAREEADRALRSVVRLKRDDPRKKIVGAGCYVERDRARLQARFPEVDAWTGVKAFDRIADIVHGRPVREPSRTFLYSEASPRLVSTPATWAYVKVSEGCSRRCAFCSIPLIKGPTVSRSVSSVVREVERLAELGIKEIDLVSHDTTAFGRDRGLRHGLVRLLERLVRVEGIEWIRFLYGYPEGLSDPLLAIMAEPKICRYLDLPFQHADPAVLKAMKRGTDGARALRLLEKVRERLPGVALRSSLIVGFPGEDTRAFASLLRFVREARFDHLGVFCYSPEKGTPSFRLPDTVAPAEKEARRREVMAVQAPISLAANRARVGKVLDVLVESVSGPGGSKLVGRTRSQAPEVDGLIRVSVPPGRRPCAAPLVEAEILSAGVYDLRGRMVP
jgi:ribosomal protein S12 methylthiotransferase